MAENHRYSTGAFDEEHERDLNVNREAELRDACRAATARLADLGIVLADVESSEIVVSLLEAVEAFERAVEAHGGDLMIDTPPSQLPDDPRFVLPRRWDDESIAAYTNRIRYAGAQLGESATG